jgi:uncharacterized protein with HEPN domain
VRKAKRRTPERLRDMLDAAAAIQRHVPASQATLLNDEVTQAAHVRWTEIIGEAANYVHPTVRDAHPEVPWRQVVDTRNRIVHTYFEIDLDILWKVITEEIPKLVPLIRTILESLPEDQE